MHVVDVEEMKRIERIAEEMGVSREEMMENAGKSVAFYVNKLFPLSRKILVVAGKGNNGGDGLVAARYLKAAGKDVKIVLSDLPSKETLSWKQLKRLKGIDVQVFNKKDFKKLLKDADLVIDALIGYGLKGNPKGKIAEIIKEINKSKKPVISVDVPSGLNANTGIPGNPCIKADTTVTLGFMKSGLLSSRAKKIAGKIYVGDIGLPEGLKSVYESFFSSPLGFFLGCVAEVIAIFGYFLILPFTLNVRAGIEIYMLIYVFLWIVAYLGLVMGISIYYFFLPQKSLEKLFFEKLLRS